MATTKGVTAQRSTTTLPTDTKSRQKDAILQCLTRLNDKPTLKVAADELSAIIRSVDAEDLAAVVQSICTNGAWEPKPFAKKECIKVLGQLPQATCPAADASLQQPHLGKVLAHLKKNLQDSDSLVRDAACDALVAYAWALAETTHAQLPGESSSSSPVVRVIFESLAEQKKEAQLGGSQALLLIAPCIGPLDKELVKLILRSIRSSTFQGTAALAAAIASFDLDSHKPVGLLKSGAEAFLPFLKHLIGQAAVRRTSSSSSRQDTASAAKQSGLLGCLCSADWAVRRAATDALRAAVLLLGPQMEPHGCWQLGDPGSLTHRCLAELEERRFDKVKEVREAIKETVVVLQHLHAFVSSVGPDGDWPAWIRTHLPQAGCLTPTPSGMNTSHSPSRPTTADSSDRRRTAAGLRTSPISKNFQRAAAHGDVVTDPYSPNAAAGAGTTDLLAAAAEGENSIASEVSAPAAGAETSSNSIGGEESASQLQQQHEQQLVGDGHDVPQVLVCDEIAMAAAGTQDGCNLPQEGQQQQELPKRHWSRSSSSSGGAAASSGRPSSAGASRPGSMHSSRRATAEQKHILSRQGSQASTIADDVLQAAAAKPRNARSHARSSNNGSAQLRQQHGASAFGNSTISSRAHTTNTGTAPAAAPGPSQEEWQQVQQQLTDLQQQLTESRQQVAEQQRLIESRQQVAEQQQQHQQAMISTIQQMQEHYSSIINALQERMATLEQQQQQQQGLLSQPLPSLSSPRSHATAALSSASPSRLSLVKSNGSSSGLTAPAAAAPTSSNPVGTPAVVRRTSRSEGGMAERERMYKSEEYTTPTSSSGRRPGLSVLDAFPGGYRSGANTPTATSSSGTRESPASASRDVETKFVEALHGDKGDVHLLRLIQKTGIAWHMLSLQTSRDLLQFFIKEVEEGVMLHRIVPWLWRLADEEDTTRPDVILQERLLEALRLCPAADEIKAQENMPLLIQTLEMCWQKKV